MEFFISGLTKNHFSSDMQGDCSWIKKSHPIFCTITVFRVFQVEYMLVKIDHKNKKAKLMIKADEVLQELNKGERAGERFVGPNI